MSTMRNSATADGSPIRMASCWRLFRLLKARIAMSSPRQGLVFDDLDPLPDQAALDDHALDRGVLARGITRVGVLRLAGETLGFPELAVLDGAEEGLDVVARAGALLADDLVGPAHHEGDGVLGGRAAAAAARPRRLVDLE